MVAEDVDRLTGGVYTFMFMFDVDIFFCSYQKSEVNFRVNVRFSVVNLGTSRQRDMGRTSISSVMLYGKSSIVFLSMKGNKAASKIRRDFPRVSCSFHSD